MKLSELKKGDTGVVLFIDNKNKIFKRKLLDMGITTGVKIMIKKIAPFGDPVCLYLRGYELCIRKKDLVNIEVNKV